MHDLTSHEPHATGDVVKGLIGKTIDNSMKDTRLYLVDKVILARITGTKYYINIIGEMLEEFFNFFRTDLNVRGQSEDAFTS